MRFNFEFCLFLTYIFPLAKKIYNKLPVLFVLFYRLANVGVKTNKNCIDSLYLSPSVFILFFARHLNKIHDLV